MSRPPVREDDEDLPEGLSKTQLKQSMSRLQDLGERLLKMRPDQWAKLPLSDSLKAALTESIRIKALEAQRRHRQYIGKLMRSEDEVALLDALERLRPPSNNRNPMELTLQRLLSEGEKAVVEVAERYHGADRHHLRQLVRMALRERERNPEATEAIQRIEIYLRELSALSR